jgi:glycosyltransferase involved in cell wall biosynthesis
MPMPELVSIVLPTYNRAAMIRPAIESCLAQTYETIEVLVVDDGSTDQTPEIVRQIAERDSRVRYLRQENAKLPAALNTGFREARGDFLTWTSDDNAYEPNAIALMVDYLRAQPKVGLVYCDCQVVNSRGEVLRVTRRAQPEAIDRTNCVGACFLYRRSVAEQVGEYDRETFLAEDYDYWLRISKVAPLAYLSGVAPYRFRVHEASLTSLRGAEAELQAARVRTKYARTPQERRRLLAAGYCAAANELRWAGRYGDAVRHNLKAIGLAAAAPFTYGNLLLTCGWSLLRWRDALGRPETSTS